MAEDRNRILIPIVDDDPVLSEILQIVLRQEGFDTTRCAMGTGTLVAMRGCQPDLMLLGLMLPGRDGVSVCRDMRAESGIPIVILTAKSETSDVVVGLQAGADDYVAKPFEAKELLARIHIRLRHVGADPGADQLTIGDLTISIMVHIAKRGSMTLSLTPLESGLLLALVERPSQVFSREALLNKA